MILFSEQITPRLAYITDFFSNEISAEKSIITTSREEYLSSSLPGINYSNQRLRENEIRIVPSGLLFEKDIRQQSIRCTEVNGYKTFFATDGDLPFDILSATFYLLSRYEEYLPHKKDLYGRYAHENSLAFREGFLNLPLINFWLRDFKNEILKKFPSAPVRQSEFRFLPTYDIDIAFSYRGKGFWTNTGGILRSFLKGDIAGIRERRNVLSGFQTDPYDSFSWMNELHKKYNLKPLYFFLVPEQKGKYDKNIRPSFPLMKELIRDAAGRYDIAIHPSWGSGDKEKLLHEEIARLESISGIKIKTNRFHYVRFNLPHSFRRLLNEGVKEDHSMGYGGINGFRASVASPFFWYDLEKETATNLLLYPFCQMDANSFYEQKYSAAQTFNEMMEYLKLVNSVGGVMVTLWHNHFLGTAAEFTGWKEAYEDFIREIST